MRGIRKAIKRLLGFDGYMVTHSPKNWLQTILMVDDTEAEERSDWTVGYYHCTHCGEYQGFAYKLPPKDAPNQVHAQMHNDRNDFWRRHAHGDGTIFLFNEDVPDNTVKDYSSQVNISRFVASIYELVVSLQWALDIVDMYEDRLIQLGDDVKLVKSQTQEIGKKKARALIMDAAAYSQIIRTFLDTNLKDFYRYLRNKHQ